MTAAWPDSTTQGGREWITPTARATFYRDVLTADHPKWFADNEGKVWRWPADDAVAKLKADMRAHEAKHANDPPEPAPTPPAGATWQDSFNADKIKTCEVWIKWHLRDASAAINAVAITKKSGETPTVYNERVVMIVNDWLKQAKAATNREYAAGGDERVARVMELVEASRTIPGMNPTTGVMRYLTKRGIDATRLPDCVRCVPRAHGNKGGLIGVVTDAAGKITGLLETILTPEGNKAEPEEPFVPPNSKRAIGHIKGNAVKLPGTAPVIACEGLEEALTVWQATGRETWACGGVGIMGDVKLRHAAPITLVRDSKDAQDSEAAHKFKMAVKSLCRHGHQVSIITSTPGKDLNDVLLAEGAEAVRGLVDAAEPVAGEIDEPEVEVKRELLLLADFVEKDLPKREWLLADKLEAGKLSIMAGHGGTLKSTLAEYMALSITSGKPIGPFMPTDAYPVISINAEDDTTEQRRRLAAILKSGDCEHINGKPDLLNTLPIYSLEADIMALVTMNEDGKIVVTPLYKWLVRQIVDHGARVVFVDPFVEMTDGINENDNAQVHKVMSLLRQIAQSLNVHVCIIHHFNKPGGADKSGSVRGGSSIVNAARMVINVEKLSDPDCKLYGINELDRHNIIKMIIPKSNNTAAGSAHFFGIVPVKLANGEQVAGVKQRFMRHVPVTTELVIEFLERVAAGRLDNSLPFTAAHTGDQVARADCIMATINAATVRRLIELARIIRDVAYD
jgi:AAA domain/Toprim domain